MRDDAFDVPLSVQEPVAGWMPLFDLWRVEKLPAPWEETIARFVADLMREFDDRSLADDPVARSVRGLFRRSGVDPTRHRPSFEALARRILRGDPLPRIHPAVDWSNLLSLRWHVPCCVADAEKLEPTVSMRVGEEGEQVESLRGWMNLAGRVLLEDRAGPYSTPISDSRRTGVTDRTRLVSFVAYCPDDAVLLDRVRADLDRFIHNNSQ